MQARTIRPAADPVQVISKPKVPFGMTFTLVVDFRVKAGSSSIQKTKALLAEGSRTYAKDKGTLSWFVMQSVKDDHAFTIVERYEQKSDVATHQANPFYATFRKAIGPLLDGGMNIKMSNEQTAEWLTEAKL